METSYRDRTLPSMDGEPMSLGQYQGQQDSADGFCVLVSGLPQAHTRLVSTGEATGREQAARRSGAHPGTASGEMPPLFAVARDELADYDRSVEPAGTYGCSHGYGHR